MWQNIEGRQDFGYKTQILFFYSENNSDSLNHPSIANLIVVHWRPYTECRIFGVKYRWSSPTPVPLVLFSCLAIKVASLWSFWQTEGPSPWFVLDYISSLNVLSAIRKKERKIIYPCRKSRGVWSHSSGSCQSSVKESRDKCISCISYCKPPSATPTTYPHNIDASFPLA